MKSEQISQILQNLHVRGGFEVVNKSAKDTQIRLMGRVPKQSMAGWLIIVQRLLLASGAGWSADISKQYFLRNERVVFGWRVIFQGPELETHITAIEQVITNAPRARAVVDEVPLVGARASRNEPGNTGKGAQGILKAAVGPMAVAKAQYMAGGGS